MADIDATLKLIALGKPVSGRTVAVLQLSLKTFEDHGWIYDRIADKLVPPGGQDGRTT